MCYFERIVMKFAHIVWFILGSYERTFFGFSRTDAWNIDSWFCKVMPKMLSYLSIHAHSCPHNMSIKEWKKQLRMMSSLFRNADPHRYDYESEMNKPLYKKWASHQKFNGNISDLSKYSLFKIWCKNKAFTMFSRYFYDLWI